MMNLSKSQIKWVKEKGDTFYLTFKHRKFPLIFIVLLSLVPVKWIAALPQAYRMIYAALFSISTAGSLPFVNNIFTTPALQFVKLVFMGNKFQKSEYSTPKIDALIQKMSLSEEVKVYTTENHLITGPCCNNFTGEIFLPTKWTHPEQEPIASISHELGHLKTRGRFAVEISLGMITIFSFTILVVLQTVPVIWKIGVFAFEMLILSYLSKRNEYRADFVGANYAGPEGLISLFEKLIFEGLNDENSETHPSFTKRIRKLTLLLDNE